MSITNKELQQRLLAMAKIDQRIRKQQWQMFKRLSTKFPDKNDPQRKLEIGKLVEELKEIDSRHTNEMKRVIQKFGWPSKNLVGKRGTEAAWLLVQHADRDPLFQEKCLNLLNEAVRLGRAEKKHLAFLTDRILTHKDKKQLYGTQFRINKNGKSEPFPIVDPDKLDIRRREVGLEPFENYKKKIRGA